MRTSTLWTVLGVIAAVIIAGLIVNVLLWFIGFVFRLALIAVVAVVVFLVLRAVFARRDAD
ncbi:hypothetical protein CSIV_16670 [Microbacterium sp. CSI-V]|uniref:hypothetical protein n=1 Tax=unclassified Microbacterium TaxID=2609290 RepID=UPI00097BB788|nr:MULTISPECIES: hypothetical protein [unclassified Microbacterium]MXS74446.1 hypothetical protein [Microbacterium sp. TL13]ONI63044.1 hypothetical protein CSIV_16670 [Microbacterium sp. CSI-V]